jgi:hypothetical protein
MELSPVSSSQIETQSSQDHKPLVRVCQKSGYAPEALQQIHQLIHPDLTACIDDVVGARLNAHALDERCKKTLLIACVY